MKKNNVPLYDKTIEQVLISSMLLKGSALEDGLKNLKSSDFYDNANGYLFSVIAELTQAGHAPDLPLVSATLKQRGASDNIISAFIDIVKNPTSVNHSEIVRQILEYSRKRQYLNMFERIIEKSKNPLITSDEILNELQTYFRNFNLSAQNNTNRIIDAAELLNMQFPTPEFLVDGIIQKGLTGIMAPPKGMKSWFILDLIISLSLGVPFMGIETKQTKGTYLALEDHDLRLQNRIKKQNIGKLIPGQCALTTQWKTGAEGLLHLHNYIQTEKPGIVGIDTLGVFSRMKDGNDYSEATDIMTGFKNLAHEHNTSIILIHHTRKSQAGGSDSDFLERTLGSQGIAGGLDSIVHISRKRGSEDATLSITGRDVEEQELAIRFNKQNCRWEMLGKSYEVADSAQRQDILDLLKIEGSLTPKEIAEHLNKNQSTTRVLIKKMVESGHIRKQEISGRYKLNEENQ